MQRRDVAKRNRQMCDALQMAGFFGHRNHRTIRYRLFHGLLSQPHLQLFACRYDCAGLLSVFFLKLEELPIPTARIPYIYQDQLVAQYLHRYQLSGTCCSLCWQAYNTALDRWNFRLMMTILANLISCQTSPFLFDWVQAAHGNIYIYMLCSHWIKIPKFYLEKIHLNISSAKGRPFFSASIC